MKKIIQILLLFAIILSSYIIYKKYFLNVEKNSSLENVNELTKNLPKNNDQNQNMVENLKYEVNLNDDQKYMINASKSEIYYENGIEFLKMKKVEAMIMDQTDFPITIRSDFGLYNSSNYNTEFNTNVKIDYFDKKIFAEKITINFNDNIIKLSENIVLTTPITKLTADNLKINLNTKKIEIYMNDKSKNVILISK
jgi:lipopolysaccharide export system protein LptC